MYRYFYTLISLLFFAFAAHAQSFDSSARSEFMDSINSFAKKQKYVQHIPQFKSGPGDLYDYLQSHVIYPSEAKKEDLSAQVFVSFLIPAKTGLPRNVKIVQSSNKLFDNEALRLIKSMPAWTPAKQGGTSVDMALTIPIYFHLH